MRHFLRFFSILILFSILSLTGCNVKNDENKQNQNDEIQDEIQDKKQNTIPLYDRGTEIISLLNESIKSDEYLSLFNSSDEISSIMMNVRKGDFSTPESVYRINFSEADILKMSGLRFDDYSPEMQKKMTSKVPPFLVSTINSMSGNLNLAASSVFTIWKTFISDELNGKNEIYLYTFADAASVAVVFIPGEDNTVYASGTFILNENFREDMETVFKNLPGGGEVSFEEITRR